MYIAFRSEHYRPLKLPLSCEIVGKRCFLVLRFVGEGIPHISDMHCHIALTARHVAGFCWVPFSELGGYLTKTKKIGYTRYVDFPNVVAGRRSYTHDASDAMFGRTTSLFTFGVMRHDSAKCHILGVAHPEIRTRRRPRFLCNTPIPPTFIILCLGLYSFRSDRVDTQTNPQTYKQTPSKTSNVLRYATTLGKDRIGLVVKPKSAHKYIGRPNNCTYNTACVEWNYMIIITVTPCVVGPLPSMICAFSLSTASGSPGYFFSASSLTASWNWANVILRLQSKNARGQKHHFATV